MVPAKRSRYGSRITGVTVSDVCETGHVYQVGEFELDVVAYIRATNAAQSIYYAILR